MMTVTEKFGLAHQKLLKAIGVIILAENARGISANELHGGLWAAREMMEEAQEEYEIVFKEMERGRAHLSANGEPA